MAADRLFLPLEHLNEWVVFADSTAGRMRFLLRAYEGEAALLRRVNLRAFREQAAKRR